jgi:hypothetical protein
MNFVTTGARYIAAFVNTALPGNTLPTVVTAQADLVLLFRGQGAARAKCYDRCVLLPRLHKLRVFSTRSVTGFTL